MRGTKSKKNRNLSIIHHHILLSVAVSVEALKKICELERHRSKWGIAIRTRVGRGEPFRRHIAKITPDWGHSDHHDGADPAEE